MSEKDIQSYAPLLSAHNMGRFVFGHGVDDTRAELAKKVTFQRCSQMLVVEGRHIPLVVCRIEGTRNGASLLHAKPYVDVSTYVFPDTRGTDFDPKGNVQHKLALQRALLTASGQFYRHGLVSEVVSADAAYLVVGDNADHTASAQSIAGKVDAALAPMQRPSRSTGTAG